ATVGGNLAHADPANDHPATMLAYDAKIIARGAKGTRTIAVDDLFTGLFETSLQPGEILTEIQIPKPVPHSGGGYIKIARKIGDCAVGAVAVQLVLDGGGAGATVKHTRIGLTNVSPIPMRAQAAEAVLLGKPITEAVLEAAGKAAAGECEPSADLRGQV